MVENKSKRIYLSALAILLYTCIFYFGACTEPEEGCIDVLASNFELDTDIDCCRDEDEECCCTFPSLTLNLIYKLNEMDTLGDAMTNFRLGEFYALENGLDSIRVDSFLFFVSKVEGVEDNNTDTLRVLETFNVTELNAEGESEVMSFQDNIALINMQSFQFILGTYRSEIDINQVNFNIGLDETIAEINPSDVQSDHPLSNEYATLFNSISMRYMTGRTGFTIRRAGEDRAVVEDVIFSGNQVNSLSSPLFINKGRVLPIIMRINVLDVFKGIIFDLPSEDIGPIINENLTSTISILDE